MRTKFTISDFEASGQYLVRTDKTFLEDTSYLSSIMFKVGYIRSAEENMHSNSSQVLISMSDGAIITKVLIKRNHQGLILNESSQWTWKYLSGETMDESKQKLVDYLNDPDTQPYRFATKEELLRVANYQTARTREQ